MFVHIAFASIRINCAEFSDIFVSSSNTDVESLHQMVKSDSEICSQCYIIGSASLLQGGIISIRQATG